MASLSLPCTENVAPTKTMTMEQAAELLSREESFMATVSAMNALMIAKGIYTADEVEAFYVQWAMNQQARPKRQRPGWRSRVLAILSFGA